MFILTINLTSIKMIKWACGKSQEEDDYRSASYEYPSPSFDLLKKAPVHHILEQITN